MHLFAPMGKTPPIHNFFGMMAGTTRLELATSAVTGGDVKYSQQLTRLLGTAKYLIIPGSRTHLGLDIGLKNEGPYRKFCAAHGGCQSPNRTNAEPKGSK